MAKKKDAPAGKRERTSGPIQVDIELARMVSTICAHDGITAGELLNGFLRPFVELNYRRVQKEIAEKVKRLDSPSGQ